MNVFVALTLLLAASAVLASPFDGGRITNGELAEQGQFPYQVGLRLFIGEKGHWCGGTLISDSWILTAAHCTYGVDKAIVFLGATDIQNDEEPGQHRIHVPKANIIVHEKYDPEVLRDDISLIKLPIRIKTNKLIQPATLPKKRADGIYEDYVGKQVWASGWGRDSDKNPNVSQFLRYIEVPIISKDQCGKFYMGSITDNMICISGKNGKSTCNGDSGGPLVYKDGDTNYVIGATSFGIILGCEKGWPGVFTRVTSYLDWIEEKSGLANY